MPSRWECRARAGLFAIESRDGRYAVLLDDEILGSYHSPESALDDLIGGHTFSPSSGVDTSEQNLPDNLAEWRHVRR